MWRVMSYPPLNSPHLKQTLANALRSQQENQSGQIPAEHPPIAETANTAAQIMNSGIIRHPSLAEALSSPFSQQQQPQSLQNQHQLLHQQQRQQLLLQQQQQQLQMQLLQQKAKASQQTILQKAAQLLSPNNPLKNFDELQKAVVFFFHIEEALAAGKIPSPHIHEHKSVVESFYKTFNFDAYFNSFTPPSLTKIASLQDIINSNIFSRYHVFFKLVGNLEQRKICIKTNAIFTVKEGFAKWLDFFYKHIREKTRYLSRQNGMEEEKNDLSQLIRFVLVLARSQSDVCLAERSGLLFNTNELLTDYFSSDAFWDLFKANHCAQYAALLIDFLPLAINDATTVQISKRHDQLVSKIKDFRKPLEQTDVTTQSAAEVVNRLRTTYKRLQKIIEAIEKVQNKASGRWPVVLEALLNSVYDDYARAVKHMHSHPNTCSDTTRRFVENIESLLNTCNYRIDNRRNGDNLKFPLVRVGFINQQIPEETPLKKLWADFVNETAALLLEDRIKAPCIQGLQESFCNWNQAMFLYSSQSEFQQKIKDFANKAQASGQTDTCNALVMRAKTFFALNATVECDIEEPIAHSQAEIFYAEKVGEWRKQTYEQALNQADITQVPCYIKTEEKGLRTFITPLHVHYKNGFLSHLSKQPEVFLVYLIKNLLGDKTIVNGHNGILEINAADYQRLKNKPRSECLVIEAPSPQANIQPPRSIKEAISAITKPVLIEEVEKVSSSVSEDVMVVVPTEFRLTQNKFLQTKWTQLQQQLSAELKSLEKSYLAALLETGCDWEAAFEELFAAQKEAITNKINRFEESATNAKAPAASVNFLVQHAKAFFGMDNSVVHDSERTLTTHGALQAAKTLYIAKMREWDQQSYQHLLRNVKHTNQQLPCYLSAADIDQVRLTPMVAIFSDHGFLTRLESDVDNKAIEALDQTCPIISTFNADNPDFELQANVSNVHFAKLCEGVRAHPRKCLVLPQMSFSAKELEEYSSSSSDSDESSEDEKMDVEKVVLKPLSSSDDESSSDGISRKRKRAMSPDDQEDEQPVKKAKIKKTSQSQLKLHRKKFQLGNAYHDNTEEGKPSFSATSTNRKGELLSINAFKQISGLRVPSLGGGDCWSTVAFETEQSLDLITRKNAALRETIVREEILKWDPALFRHNAKKVPWVTLDKGAKGYQNTMAQKLLNSCAQGYMPVNAMKMGLGKTRTAAVMLTQKIARDKEPSIHLIVEPTSLVNSIHLELKSSLKNAAKEARHLSSTDEFPSLNSFKRTDWDRNSFVCRTHQELKNVIGNYNNDRPLVIVTSHDALKKVELENIEGRKNWGSFVVDEAQRARATAHSQKENSASLRPMLQKWLARIDSDNTGREPAIRALLTATPLENTYGEFWNALALGNPKHFEPAKLKALDVVFKQTLESVVDLSSKKADSEKAAKNLMMSFLQFSSFKAAASQLVNWLDFYDPSVKAAWGELVTENRQKLNVKLTDKVSGIFREKFAEMQENVLNREIFTNKCLFDPDLPSLNGDDEATKNYINTIKGLNTEGLKEYCQNSPILKALLEQKVFEGFVFKDKKAVFLVDNLVIADLMEHIVNKLYGNIETKPYSGDNTIVERDACVAWFKKQDKTSKILFLMKKAGGVGLNLQEGQEVYLLTASWNPFQDEQGISRVIRVNDRSKEPKKVHELSFFNPDGQAPYFERHKHTIRKEKRLFAKFFKTDKKDPVALFQLWMSIVETVCAHEIAKKIPKNLESEPEKYLAEKLTILHANMQELAKMIDETTIVQQYKENILSLFPIDQSAAEPASAPQTPVSVPEQPQEPQLTVEPELVALSPSDYWVFPVPHKQGSDEAVAMSLHAPKYPSDINELKGRLDADKRKRIDSKKDIRNGVSTNSATIQAYNAFKAKLDRENGRSLDGVTVNIFEYSPKANKYTLVETKGTGPNKVLLNVSKQSNGENHYDVLMQDQA